MPERAYVPAEQVRTAAGLAMVPLSDVPMTVGEVMDWLMVRGYVEAVPCECGDCAGVEYRNWGRPFFAVGAYKVTRG